MASKEATVYIVDCGMTMGETSHGRAQTNLDWALEYVWDRITATIATGRKTAMAGVVGLRTDGTSNFLESESEYANITVFQDIGQVFMAQVRRLRGELVVSSTDAGDAMSALIIAIQMIVNTCKKLKYERKIVLITDARGSMQADDLEAVVEKLKEDATQLVVLGVDFDDPEYGFKEEDKPTSKAENEAILKQLCQDCGGTFGTLAQAVDELSVPRVKSVRPTPSYKGSLTLGNPQEFDTALSIDVERYPKTMTAPAQSASRFVVRSDLAPSEVMQATQTLDGEAAPNGYSEGLSAVKNALSYQVDDENAPGGKRDIDRDELAKGYEYGRTAVHISESDRNVTTYETVPSFDIIGFVDKSQYERWMDMTRAALTIAQRGNDKAIMALSSFIHALYELESYAVARLVKKENNEPRIVLVAPCIEPDLECLYDVELPFTEDLRSYKFPPLDRIITVSGKELKVHRNLPNEDLQAAMSDYVDSMDLATFGTNDEGEPTEYMPMDETFSPMLHRIQQVIKHRAVFPESEPPPPADVLVRYSHSPAELVQQSKSALSRVVKAADVKKVPPKARGRRFGRGKEAPKPLSDLDVGALLAKDMKRKRRRIDPDNAIPEFKQLIDAQDTEEALDVVHDACKQFKDIICDWIKHSVGNSGYGRAIEGIRVMRENMAEIDEAGFFNEVLRDIKAKLLGGELGDGRSEMWYMVRVNKLGLLQDQDATNGVSAEEAKAFLTAK
ncbi:hypothetical protein BAUCODRAFT_172807 [Baudoinia panamericana UAMH 10762]|uniref:ATP-dependent DNA helicase II subunit 2 n=1 Tax=Baudoinia panamericana (strain UAMH 10762) TaxID=717646 RepID=M2N8S8_BAUPA|nr:uncharacterized protein BAUCODRAFT_172807 [Baudoinia panamericana UAMH 10762]EMD00539.1 hypothetical protein BAUCODRAFT_172807 [Baudoinia panamericana UAMH 10762]